MASFKVSSWTCINRLPSFPIDWWYALESHDLPITPTTPEGTESQHREEVLLAANRIVQSRKKRRRPTSPFRVTKRRTKNATLPNILKTEERRNRGQSLALTAKTDEATKSVTLKDTARADCHFPLPPKQLSEAVTRSAITRFDTPRQHAITPKVNNSSEPSLPTDGPLPSSVELQTAEDSPSGGWSDITVVTREEKEENMFSTPGTNAWDGSTAMTECDEDFPTFEELRQMNQSRQALTAKDITVFNQTSGPTCYTQTPSSVGPNSPTFSTPSSTVSTPIHPFLRTVYPTQTLHLSESPLPLIAAQDRVVTCFRIAELLRLVTAHDTTTLTFELFARVIQSERTPTNQTFRFADIFFPARPPYLHAYCTTWQNSKLYDEDAAAFSTTKIVRSDVEGCPQKFCRVILKTSTARFKGTAGTVEGDPVRHQAVDSNVKYEVLSIWKSTWAEIEHVRGIVDPMLETS